MQKLQPLRCRLDKERCDPGEIAARLVEAVDKPDFDRIISGREDDGIVRVAAFAARAETVPPVETRTATGFLTSSAASMGS